MVDNEIRLFWEALHKRTYQSRPDMRESALGMLHDLMELFKIRRHLCVTEISIYDLSGKKLLDLGCGAGSHSALFSYLGANVFSVDMAVGRVRHTVALAPCQPVVADMRRLPFADDSFDIVYSNGAIHHAPRETDTVSEIHRVLRPGGMATVMIYAKNSFLYRGVLWPFRGLLQGGIFRNGNWLGRATEWLPDGNQTSWNPYTSVFSSREAMSLFGGFRNVKIRKNAFVFDQIPVVGKWLGCIVGMFTGYNKSGIIVYGKPWRKECAIELWLSRFIGFGLNIRASK